MVLLRRGCLRLLAALLWCLSARAAEHYRVGIIGGGIAGLQAAATLQKHGVTDWLLLESSDRLGGRVHSVRLGNGVMIETGAAWIEGTEGNPIYALARDCGLVNPGSATVTNWDDIEVFDETGRRLAANDSRVRWDDFDAAFECVGGAFRAQVQAGELQDRDARAALRFCGWEPRSPLDWAVEWYYENFEFAEPPEMLSAVHNHPLASYADFKDAALQMHPQGGAGFGGIGPCLARRAGLPDARLALGHHVSRIEPRGDGGPGSSVLVTVDVRGGGEREYEFDYVISTMSAGVLQRHLASLFRNTTTWRPAQRAALMQARMADFAKMYLQFAHNFWGGSQFYLQAPGPGGSDFAVVWQSLSPSDGYLPGSNVLLATTTGAQAMQLEALSDAQVVALLMAKLRKAFPGAPEPVAWHFPRWYSDDRFAGTFTNWPAGMSERQYDAFRAPIGRLHISGEATCKRFTGYMHGAYGAGERSARTVLRDMGVQGVPHPDDSFCERQLTEQGRPLSTARMAAARTGGA